MVTGGMSENWAIRLLEQVTKMYAKYRVFGYVAVDRADQYTHWSKAARAALAANSNLAAKTIIRNSKVHFPLFERPV